MKFDLVVLDLDGTIYDPAEVPGVRPRVVETVRRVQERGVGVTLATGRTLEFLGPLARLLDIRLPVIAAGGAVVGNPLTGQVLDFQPVPRAEALKAMAWAAEAGPETAFYLRGPSGLRILQTREDRPAEYYDQLIGRPRELAPAPHPGEGEELIKLIVVSPFDRPHPDVEVLARRVAPAVKLTRTHHQLVEGQNAAVDKGRGLELLLERLKIPRERVLALGDNDNDLPLFRRAGLGVAMGDAPEPIKQAAGWVAPGFEEDGAAVALEKFLL